MGDFEELAEGHSVSRDEEGKFTDAHLTSERAKEISALGHEAQRTRPAAEAKDLGDRIRRAYLNGNDEDIRQVTADVLGHLGRLVGLGKASSPALETIASFLKDLRPSRIPPPATGDTCPVCREVKGHQQIYLNLSDRVAENWRAAGIIKRGDLKQQKGVSAG